MARPAVYRPEPIGLEAPAPSPAVVITLILEVADVAELEAVLERVQRRLPRRGVRVLGVQTPLEGPR